MPNWLGPKRPKSFPRGIKVLYNPPNATVDIVFVHGLTGDRDRTWTAPGPDSAPWPQTGLPSVIPNARILTFGYDAYISNWKHVVSENRLNNHARDLLHDLWVCRRKEARNRCIVFVAHSLGGLVVKDALLAAFKSEDEHLRLLLECTRGIAFLGTPHTGSGLAKWAERSIRLVGIFKQSNPDVVALLRQDSEVLSRVHDDFLRMIRLKAESGDRIAITCFYEALPMPLVGFIVPKESAVIAGYNHVSIQGNHRDMARFSSCEDPGFLSVSGEIERWVNDLNITSRASEVAIGNLEPSNQIPTSSSDEPQASQQAPLTEIEKECLQSLAFPQMDNRRLAIDNPAEDTGEWLFGHETYQAWYNRSYIDRSHGCLWIKGKPGSGKSTLMKRLVKQLDTEKTQESTCLAFFFNARGSVMERSLHGLYRSLTHQLVWRRRLLLSTLAAVFEDKHTRLGKAASEWHTNELTEFFHESICQSGPKPITLAIDALDECDYEDVHNVVRAFERSAATAVSRGVELKVCLSSRHYPLIKIRRCLELRLEDENASDIALYVRSEIQNRDIPSQDVDIAEEILRKANGVFLWVRLILHSLFNAAEYEQKNAQDILKTLRQLPSELDSLFRVILEPVIATHRSEMLLLFQLVVLAASPLSLANLGYAMGFSSDPPPPSIASLESSDTYNRTIGALTGLIRDRSGGLLEVIWADKPCSADAIIMSEMGDAETKSAVDPTDERRPGVAQMASDSIDTVGKGLIVQVIHESVRDFFTSGSALEITGLTDALDFAQFGHERLKRSCLAYLTVEELRNIPPVRLLGKRVNSSFSFLDENERRKFLDEAQNSRWKAIHAKPSRALRVLEHPFTKYAADQWLFHAIVAEQLGKPQTDLSDWAKNPAFERWISLINLNFNPRIMTWLRTERSLKAEALLFHIVCKIGLSSSIASFVADGVDPSCTIEGNERALLIAASCGHDKVVRALLDCGVPVETSRSPSTTNALHEAVNNGRLEVIKTLLDRGIDPETPTGNGQTALCLAASQGREELIRILIERGADVNNLGRGGRSALHQVARLGPHDLGTQEGWGMTCAEALIEVRADLDIRDNRGKTPLALAAMQGNVEMVQLLVDAGGEFESLSVREDGTVDPRTYSDEVVAVLEEAGLTFRLPDLNADEEEWPNQWYRSDDAIIL